MKHLVPLGIASAGLTIMMVTLARKGHAKRAAAPAPSVAPPVAATKPAGRPTLRKGAVGSDVKALQTALGIAAPSGAFDEATETKVKAFQTAKGLTADGVVGPKTWAALGVK